MLQLPLSLIKALKVCALVLFVFTMQYTAFQQSGSVAWAQNFTVQQPVVSRFGVGTTVVVPDRGSAYLGSVARSAMSRSDHGPLNFSRPIGKEQSHKGTSASVYIHDFDAIDRALLGENSDVASRKGTIRYGSVSSSTHDGRRSMKAGYRVVGMPSRFYHNSRRQPHTRLNTKSTTRKPASSHGLTLEELEQSLQKR